MAFVLPIEIEKDCKFSEHGMRSRERLCQSPIVSSADIVKHICKLVFKSIFLVSPFLCWGLCLGSGADVTISRM
ncbi:MAG: hypothetical protein H6Q67_2363 [Firmicutes bacterium]|nr:hypothetical protein [Bacillota bacterium]